MRNTTGIKRMVGACLLAAVSSGALADVTIQQQTAYDLAVIKMHGTTTEYTSADKQRRDTDNHCEGFMSLFCGNAQGGEITRLDRDLTWSLDPKRKQYRETHLPTAAERQAMQAQLQADMAKMQQCPAMQQSAAPDTSKCDMSPPVFDVKTTDQHATFAGHDARLTTVSMSQTCRAHDTGDECKVALIFDSWLTQDDIAGVEDLRAFRLAYAKKLGLDDPNGMVQKQMRQFLAPYLASLKSLQDKSGDLKGFALKTRVRIAFGGEHCAAARQSAANGSGSTVGDAGAAAGSAAASSASGEATSAATSAAAGAARNGALGSVLGSAAGAFTSKLAGGLFAKKSAPAAAPAPAPEAGLEPGMVQAGSITIETTAITPGAIPASQFDLPAGWSLVTPKAQESKELTCPKPG